MKATAIRPVPAATARALPAGGWRLYVCLALFAAASTTSGAALAAGPVEAGQVVNAGTGGVMGGDLDMRAGAILRVHAGAPLTVNGDTSLDNGIVIERASEIWKMDTDYVILVASGANNLNSFVTRTGEKTLSSYSVSSRNDSLVLTNTRHSAQRHATTWNQTQMAGALDRLPDSNPVFSAVDNLDPRYGQPQRAYDRLSGAHYASLPGLLFQRDMGYGFGLLRRQAALAAQVCFGEGATYLPAPSRPPNPPANPPAMAVMEYREPLVAQFETPYETASETSADAGYCDPCLEASAPTVQYDGVLPSLVVPAFFVNRVWAEFDVDRVQNRADRNGPKSKLYGPGLSVGYEAASLSGWMGGAAFRYGNLRQKTDELDSRSDIDSYTFALYGGKVMPNRWGQWRLSAGASYSRHQIDARRNVAIGTFHNRLKGKYHADSYQLFTEAAQTLYYGRTTIEPFLNLGWSHIRASSFSERGGAAALRSKSESYDHVATVLGARGFFSLSERLTLDGSLGWRHVFGDRRPESSMAFVATGAGFKTRGSAIDRDALVASVGATYMIYHNLAVGIGYDGSYGDRGSSHTGMVRVTYGF